MRKKNLFIKYFTYISIFITIFEILFLIFNLPAYAANNTSQILRISPVIINVNLSPGKTYRYQVTLTNLTDHPIPLQATLNDFLTTGEEGGYIFEDSRTNPLLSWITLSQQEVILSAKESKKIDLTVTTPKNIPFGGYYGLLFFEPVSQGWPLQETHIVPRVGILMLANIGTSDPNAKKAQILTFDTGLLHETATIPLLLRVKNISLHFFTAKPIITVSPVIPLPVKPAGQLILQDKIMFQDKIRRWEQQITLPYTLPDIYKVHMAVSVGDGDYVSQDNYIIVFPYKETGIAAVIIIIAGFLVIKRKRLKRALIVFFKK